MGRWLQLRDRYLHLLLEMQGLTMDPTCSICSKPMEIKCDDCFGANYFCRTCCLDAHQRSPYHRILRWTGSHFVPMSQYIRGRPVPYIIILGYSSVIRELYWNGCALPSLKVAGPPKQSIPSHHPQPPTMPMTL